MLEESMKVYDNDIAKKKSQRKGRGDYPPLPIAYN
jgi:hypothetical protein